MITKNPSRKIGGRLDVKFADKIYETLTTYMTDELVFSIEPPC